MIHKRHEGIPARPASYLLLATSLSAILILRGATPTAAAKMKTVDTMDDDSDMVEDFAREMMEESMFNMYDEKTGALLNNSKAFLLNSDPDRPDHFDVGLFVDDKDVKYEPESTQNVSICDFQFPENCMKEIPYKGAPDDYDCGESDETSPNTGFSCVNLTAVTDKDGDLSLIDEGDSASPLCRDDPGKEEDDNTNLTRRRLMAAPRARRRPGARSRSIRTAGARGFGR